MKRFHIHVSADDLAQSIGFYSTLFGAGPARVEADYAKWMPVFNQGSSIVPTPAKRVATQAECCAPKAIREPEAHQSGRCA
jgi:predicted enzyme related to lactoylglutathione lyase